MFQDTMLVSLAIMVDKEGVFVPQRLQERLPIVAAKKLEHIYHSHMITLTTEGIECPDSRPLSENCKGLESWMQGVPCQC